MDRPYIPPPPPNPEGQAKLIAKTFGLTFIKPKFFKVDTDTMFTEKDAINAAILDSNETLSDSRSKFGLPKFDDILFEQVDYTSNDGKNIRVPPFSMGTALCDVTMTRNIVKTQIAGRNGTVKEYMSDGDLQINIKGVLASLYQNIAPKDSVKNLLQFCNAPVNFNVTSNFLAYFGVYTIVVEDYTFNQLEGKRNVISFELHCSSDMPIEIKGSKSVPSFI